MDQNLGQPHLVKTVTSQQAMALAATTGSRTRAAWLVLLAGIVAGLTIAIVWLPAIVDNTIDVNLASTIIGTNAASLTLTGAGLVEAWS